MDTNTTDGILEVLEQWAREKRPIDPTAYVEAAQKLVTLMGDEHDRLFLLEQKVAKARIEYLEGGMSATAARMHAETSEDYLEARRQKAKISRIEETVRLAKLRGRMASEEMRAQ